MQPPEYLGKASLLFRVFDGGFPLEQVTDGDTHPFHNIPEIDALQESHRLPVHFH